MKIFRYGCILLLVLLLLCSCGRAGYSEPEQICPVSAIGFDREGDGIRVTVEIPVSGEGTEGETSAMVFSGTGDSTQEALQNIAAGFSKKLIFSHCALMVLGEGLSREQLDAVFAFADTGKVLPLATQVIAASDAGALLQVAGRAEPASGYDIPGILKQESRLLGIDIRCRIYELRSNASPFRPVPLPLFETEGEGKDQRAIFCGLRILRDGNTAVTLDRKQSVLYAMLTDSFNGGNGEPGGLFNVELYAIRSEIGAEKQGNTLLMKIHLSMETGSGPDEKERSELQAQIEQSMAIFCRDMQAQGASDLFCTRDRIAQEQPQLWEEIREEYDVLIVNAEPEVTCTVKGGNRR